MQTTEHELRQAALRKQLEIMETRIVVHGNRIWQLPFTYIGFSAIAASVAVENSGAFPAQAIFFALALLGGLVLWAMADACKSYERTGSAMNKVEKELRLDIPGTATSGSRDHAKPHFVICLAAIVALAAGGIWIAP